MLLVDDVRNTGHTLSQCAAAVRAAGGVLLATAEIYDRLEAIVDLDVPNIALAEYKAPENYPVGACPLCAAGTPVDYFLVERLRLGGSVFFGPAVRGSDEQLPNRASPFRGRSDHPEFDQALGEYERMSNEVVATEDGLRAWLFGERPAAEVVLAYVDETVVGFALFFHNFSTFLGRPGLYLEDLFVMPEWRGRGIGRRLLVHLADIAVRARVRADGVGGLGLE